MADHWAQLRSLSEQALRGSPVAPQDVLTALRAVSVVARFNPTVKTIDQLGPARRKLFLERIKTDPSDGSPLKASSRGDEARWHFIKHRYQGDTQAPTVAAYVQEARAAIARPSEAWVSRPTDKLTILVGSQEGCPLGQNCLMVVLGMNGVPEITSCYPLASTTLEKKASDNLWRGDPYCQIYPYFSHEVFNE